jgi:Ca-activated chloride channel homolog
MNDRHVIEWIDEYVDGTLADEKRILVERHLVECSSCREELEQTRALLGKLKSLPETIEPPAGLADGLEAKLMGSGGLTDGANRADGRMDAVPVIPLKVPDRRRFYSGWAFRAAAMILVAISSGVIWYSLRNQPAAAPPVSAGTAISDNRVPSDTISHPATVHPGKTVEQISGKEQKHVSRSHRKEMLSPKSQHPAEKKLMAGMISPQIQGDSVHHSGANAVTASGVTTAKGIVAEVASQPDSGFTLTYSRVTTRSGKTVTIRGRVVEAESNTPLSGVNVLVVGTNRGAVTDSSGRFTIIGVPPGVHQVRVQMVGYASVTITDIRMKANYLITTPDIRLQSQSVALSDITITSTRPLINAMATNSSVTVYSSKALISAPKGTESQGGQMFLRGGRANEEQYQIDGLRAYKALSQLKRSNPNFNTENYDRINENEFLDALTSPLSTFSIDVDATSYANVRRFITDGQLPPKDAVRIEEMINYFKYSYPQPSGRDPFSITAEAAECPWNPDHSLVLIGLQGKTIPLEDLAPSNLVFLIDVSGSMDEPNKLPLVKEAFRLLVKQLRDEDHVAIVVYAGNAGLVLPSTRGSNKEKILHAIDKLDAGGSTAGGAGIQLAYKVAGENFVRGGNNRVILATDGDFNVGVSSDAEMVRLIEQKRDEGVYLSVLGFGTGNLKDSKMEKLADKGNGNYAYIDNIQEARRVFVSQMAGTLWTIAKDVKIQVEFNPAKVKAYRLIGYEDRLLAKEDFNDDRKDAGELGSGHTVTALYEIIPSGGHVDLPDVDDLKYQRQKIDPDAFRSDEMMTVKFRYKQPDADDSRLIVKPLKETREEFEDASENLRWAASVAEFGMILRDSKFKGSSSYRSVLRTAEEAKGRDRDGYREEFLRLVEKSHDIDRRDHRDD